MFLGGLTDVSVGDFREPLEEFFVTELQECCFASWTVRLPQKQLGDDDFDCDKLTGEFGLFCWFPRHWSPFMICRYTGREIVSPADKLNLQMSSDSLPREPDKTDSSNVTHQRSDARDAKKS